LQPEPIKVLSVIGQRTKEQIPELISTTHVSLTNPVTLNYFDEEQRGLPFLSIQGGGGEGWQNFM